MKTTAFAFAALAAGGVLAAPSPKIPSVRYPSLRPRPKLVDNAIVPPVSNLAVQQQSTTTYDVPTTTAPRANIWAPLSSDEAASIVAFLHNQTALNLTAASDAGSWDNMISTLDLAAPNKTEALQYINTNNTSPPPRYAIATIMFNALEKAYLEDFLVGPLPLSENSTYSPYNFRTTKGTSKIRNRDADEEKVSEFVANITSEVDDIVEYLLGAPSSEFDIWGIDPLWTEEGRTISWMGYWGIPFDQPFDSETLNPQGLYLKLDITGRDPKGWAHLGWLHNNVYYPTSADFRHAYENKKVKLTTRNNGANETWGGTDRVGDALPYDERPPPMQVSTAQRYAVDEEERYVEWMDFSFYYTFRRDSGLRLYDIKYKGERIIYELGLAEALAHYAGNDPVQSGTAYLDTFYGFGPWAFELVEGYDCPTYASYLNTSFNANEVHTVHRKSICLYEEDVGMPIARHSSGQYVASTKNIAFKIKSVSTVGNYDYSFTYTFYLDGSIESHVSASGYIQSAYYAENDEYGYKIHDGLSGSLHTHVLNYKVDIDVLGTNNTFAFHSVAPHEVKYAWSNETRSTFKLERSELQSEKNSSLNWPSNAHSMYLIYNKEEKNKYGEERAYRIMPSRGGGIHTAMQKSSNLGPSMNFATSQLYVTKQHDSEFTSSHASNAYDPYNPVIDFGKYLDDEELVQEDLVLWVNQGMHHVPHTGDLGNTVQTTAQASFIISPHNYLLRDPSRQTKQMVRLNYNGSNEDVVSKVYTFGSEPATGMVNLTALQPDYYSYTGDSNVRKFPYDPQHPYNETISIV